MHAKEKSVATLTIRNLDDTVVERLKQRAIRHGRSLEAEVRQILLRTAGNPPLTPEEAVERARRIAAMTPKGVKQTDSTEMIRKMRDGDER
jgi:phosphopantothenoylcysteine decarboxylase/phosphopantothenate--cysteine ligase